MRTGQRVVIDASVADERGQVQRGTEARVVDGANVYNDQHGVRRVAVQTEDGQLLGVPVRAVREKENRR
jgi:hypothetical protein